jgi:fatty acid desaturase
VNSKKQDGNQRQRFVQSLYRKKYNKKLRRVDDSKIWTVVFWISALIGFLILIISEIFFIDRGKPLPEIFAKLFHRVF